jgi:hypothetical protein
VFVLRARKQSLSLFELSCIFVPSLSWQMSGLQFFAVSNSRRFSLRLTSASRLFHGLLEPRDPAARAEQPFAAAALVPSWPTHQPPPLKTSSHLSLSAPIPSLK